MQNIEEVFWRYAKKDGQSITLSKSNLKGYPRPGMLAQIRFVEMSDEEIAQVLKDRQSGEIKISIRPMIFIIAFTNQTPQYLTIGIV